MLRGRIREGRQAIIEIDVILRDGGRYPLAVAIDTGFNGQVSFSRQLVEELDPPLIYQGSVGI